jgi:flagellar basal-body rod protein FlgC
MANAETTRGLDGRPYQRQHVIFEQAGEQSFGDVMTSECRSSLSSGVNDAVSAPGGVSVASVFAENSAPLRRYDPQHPDAGSDGYVEFPNINPLTEMVDLMGATRSYGMNASAVQAEKNMVSSSLEILK